MRIQVVPPIAIPAVWDFVRGGGLSLAPPAAAPVVVEEAKGPVAVLAMKPVGADREGSRVASPVGSVVASDGFAGAPDELGLSDCVLSPSAPVVSGSISEVGIGCSGLEEVSKVFSTLGVSDTVVTGAVPVVTGPLTPEVTMRDPLVEPEIAAVEPGSGKTNRGVVVGAPVGVGLARVSLAGICVTWLVAKPDVSDETAVCAVEGLKREKSGREIELVDIDAVGELGASDPERMESVACELTSKVGDIVGVSVGSGEAPVPEAPGSEMPLGVGIGSDVGRPEGALNVSETGMPSLEAGADGVGASVDEGIGTSVAGELGIEPTPELDRVGRSVVPGAKSVDIDGS